MEPLRLFGIPITPIGYYMNCVLTIAQIELMATDVSVVDYGTGKDGKNRKGGFDDAKADSGAVARASERWLREHGGDGERAGWRDVRDVLGGKLRTDVGVKLR